MLHRSAVIDLHAGFVYMRWMWFADMLGQDLSRAVEAALFDLVLEPRHAGDGLVVLDRRAAGGDACHRALNSSHLGKLPFDALIVERGQHAANIQSGCFHALPLSLHSTGFAAFTWTRRLAGQPDCSPWRILQQHDNWAAFTVRLT
jgi:hypothetical protein